MNDDNDTREVSAEPSPCEDGAEPEYRSSQTAIRDLPINLRIFQALESAGIKTVGELRDWSEPQLLKIRNLGRRSLSELKEIIGDYDVDLRQRSPEEMAELTKPSQRVRCAYTSHHFECQRTAMQGNDLCWSHERMRQGEAGSTPNGYYGARRWRAKVLDSLKHDGQQMQFRLSEAQRRVQECKAALAEIDRLIGMIKTLPDNTLKPKRRSA